MTDPGLKLPLSIMPYANEFEIRESDTMPIVSVWIPLHDKPTIDRAHHRAEVIKAALTADAEEDRPSAERVASIRPCVLHFAVEMERKLRANDWKEHWSNFSVEYLAERISDELAELTHAVAKLSAAEDAGEDLGILALSVMEEAVDLANFSMMIGDMIDRMEPDAEKHSCSTDCVWVNLLGVRTRLHVPECPNQDAEKGERDG